MISLIAVALMLVSLDAYMPVTNKVFRPNARVFATKDGLRTMENVTRVSMKSVAGLALALTGLLTSAGPAAAILSDLKITNNTNYNAVVSIKYTGLQFLGLCKNDSFVLDQSEIKSIERGACLIDKVGASMIVPLKGKVEADPWTKAIPLPASTFEIKEVEVNKFKVM